MKILRSLILVHLALFTLSQNISYHTTTQFFYPQLELLNVVNDLWIYPPNSIFNTSSQSLVSWPQGNCTAQGPFVDSKNNLWCLAYNSTYQEYTINLLSNETLQTVGAYSALLGNNNATGVQATGDYLIFTNSQSSVINGSLSVVHQAVNAFDIKHNTVSCVNASVSVTTNSPNFPLTFTGDGYVYATNSDDKNETEIVYLGCNGKSESSKTGSTYEDISIASFNKASVFAHVYLKGLGVNELYYTPFSLSKDGKATFGSEYNVPGFWVVDDSSFLIPDFTDKGKVDFRLFTIDDKLNPSEVKKYKTDIIASILEISVIPNSLTVAFTLDKGGFILLDLESGEVLSVTGILPPITLADGTVVNVTSVGYFTQTTKEKSIHFNPFDWNGLYQDPTNPQHVYIMNIPSALNGNSEEGCSVVNINPDANSTQQTNFDNCPIVQNSGFLIKDVSIDVKGNNVVTYRDTVNNLYIVSPHNAWGPLKTTSLYTYPAISINYTNGTGTFVGAQLIPAQYIFGSFFINNGSVYNKFSFGSTSNYNTAYKLHEDYVLLASSTSGSTNFSVWNIINFTMVYSFVSQVPVPLSNQVPFFALNVDPVNNPTTIFDGLVVLNSVYTNGVNLPYLVNPDGNFTQYVSDVNINKLEQVYPVGSDSILLQSSMDFFITQNIVEVSDWGLNSTEAIYI